MSNEKPRPRQLGRGLEALFGEDRTNIAAAEQVVARVVVHLDVRAVDEVLRARVCERSDTSRS